MLKKILSILSILIFTFKLQAKPPDDLKIFFFPYQHFFKAKVYKYADKNNNENIQYWFMQTEINENDTILITKVFTKDLKQIELFKEKITTQGTILLEFTKINNRDVSTTEPIDTLVYKWQLPKNEEIKWSVHYQSNYGYETFSKTRKFISIDAPKYFKNKSFYTVKFKDTFLVTTQTNQATDSYSFYQYSYYCKSLGMFSYERFIPNGSLIHYYLDEILTEKEWNKLKKKK